MAGIILSKDQIEKFQRTGVLVVPNILTSEEIDCTRAALHQELLKYGVVRTKASFHVKKI